MDDLESYFSGTAIPSTAPTAAATSNSISNFGGTIADLLNTAVAGYTAITSAKVANQTAQVKLAATQAAATQATATTTGNRTMLYVAGGVLALIGILFAFRRA
jgi:hypothetical protein